MKHAKWCLLALSIVSLLLLSACGFGKKTPESSRSPIIPPEITPNSVSGATPAANHSGNVDIIPSGGDSGADTGGLPGGGNSSGGGNAPSGNSGEEEDGEEGSSSSTDKTGEIELPIVPVEDLQP